MSPTVLAITITLDISCIYGRWSNCDLFMHYVRGAISHKQGSSTDSSPLLGFSLDNDCRPDEASLPKPQHDLGDKMATASDKEPDLGYSAAESDSSGEEDGAGSKDANMDDLDEGSGEDLDLGPDNGEENVEGDLDIYEAEGFAPL